ncbi:related to Adaptin medium chain homolog APM2 [Zygosaccharomyces bailii]|nr:related to Adaptin medium chain homolog APM2 [Zygosaccharomyces bailii]
MSSCIYILDEDLEPLISKNIKSIPNLQAVVKLFQEAYTPTAPPIIFNRSWYFIHTKRASLMFLSAVHFNDESANIMSIAVYIDRFYVLLKKYLGVTELDRTMVLDNVLLILELFDESMDYGIAQMTEPGVMRDYIRVKVNQPGTSIDDLEEASSDEEAEKSAEQESQDNRKVKKLNRQSFYGFLQKTQTVLSKRGHDSDNEEEKEMEKSDLYINSYIASTTVMPISWRAKGIHYGKNEFFLDVVEKVQYVADFREGIVRKNLIHGRIHCKCYLSGMPKLRIALNKLLQQDAQFMAHSKFHHCVATESLNQKELEFVPPDGDFVLCEYELKRHVNDIPMLKITSFEVKPKLKKFKVQISVQLESHFKSRNFTSILNVKVPLQLLFDRYQIDLSKPTRFKSDSGQVLFNLSDDFLLWEIGQMRGGHGETQLAMTAEFSLFNREEYEREQEERKHSMNPPPLREGPKLEELYAQTHSQKDSNLAIKSVESQLVSINFEIPYITCSGLKVEYLKIEEEQLQYQSFPWIRYKTVSDEEYAYLT